MQTYSANYTSAISEWKKTRRLARNSIYWPKINDDIVKVVGACTPCQEAQPRQQKEPLQPQEIPTTPWTKLGTDLFELDGEDFLLIVDYHSKYPVVHKMTSTTSASVAQATAATFGLLGVPVEIISDNGPQFAGAAYNDMCAKWSVTHTTASPRYPRSNGQAERMVRTVKSMLKKCRRTGQDAHMALLHLRATPIDANLPAPAEILFGRPVRTTLPSNNPYDKLQAQADNNEHLQTRRDDMKRNHDQQAGPPLPPLYVGQKVRALDTPSKSWIPGEITKVRQEPRSYEVRTPNGNTLRRNRSHLREMHDQGRNACTPSASASVAQPKRIQFDNAPKHVRFAELPNVRGNCKTMPAHMPKIPKTDMAHRDKSAQAANNANPVQPSTTTRSGRVSRKPARYQDD